MRQPLARGIPSLDKKRYKNLSFVEARLVVHAPFFSVTPPINWSCVQYQKKPSLSYPKNKQTNICSIMSRKRKFQSVAAAEVVAPPASFQALPTDVANHLAKLLPMRDFLRLRGVDSDLYNRITFLGEPMACLARLRPGLINALREQRGNRLVHLGLRLTFPPTQLELDALVELRSLTHLKSLEFEFHEDPEDEKKMAEFEARMENDDGIGYSSDPDEEFDPNAQQELEAAFDARYWGSIEKRARAAGLVLRQTLALGLHSLCIRSKVWKESSMYHVVNPCVMANRDTLEHVALPRLETYENLLRMPDMNAFARLLLDVKSLRVEGEIPGVTRPSHRAGSAAAAAAASPPVIESSTLRYLKLNISDRHDMESLPLATLPHTLQGFSIQAAYTNLQWVCPPRVEFLHINVNSDLAKVLMRHVPPDHAALRQLVITLPYDFASVAPNDRMTDIKAFVSGWLKQATLPALESLSVQVGEMDNLHARTLEVFCKRLPHLRYLYVNTRADLLEEKVGMIRAMLAKSEARRIEIIGGPLPELEAEFLLRHDLSIMSPCTHADVVVENDRDQSHLLQLQPTSVLRVRSGQRRKL
jgi:hypothetical protein